MKLTYTIQKPVDFVFGCLTNMRTFLLVHPVITKVNYLEKEQYLIFETFKWRFFSCSFTYPATIESDYESKRVVMTATVMEICTIEMVFDIEEAQGFAIVKEVVTFKTKLPIKLILGQIFKKQHAQLFKNIENLKAYISID